jgi:hypothetical protein
MLIAEGAWRPEGKPLHGRTTTSSHLIQVPAVRIVIEYVAAAPLMASKRKARHIRE